MLEINFHLIQPNVYSFFFMRNERSATFESLFDELQSTPQFIDELTKKLAELPFKAFFLEFPPLTKERLGNPANFVVVRAKALEGIQANPLPFWRYLRLGKNKEVISFVNLGRDAQLVVPTPKSEDDQVYAHLATFLRRAPQKQIRELWQEVSKQMNSQLDQNPSKPVWLSTSGLGVYWLHLRLDSRPKYYTYQPYKKFEQ